MPEKLFAVFVKHRLFEEEQNESTSSLILYLNTSRAVILKYCRKHPKVEEMTKKSLTSNFSINSL